jgi:hypothetical protein
MKRKLSICLLLALPAAVLAQDPAATNPAAPAGDADTVAARRARLEQWRTGAMGETNHYDFSNSTSNTNEDSANRLSPEERRARIKARLKEWRDSRVPTDTNSVLTNLPAAPAPGADAH